MTHKPIDIKFTKHATAKMRQRSIAVKDIRDIVSKPETVEKDRFDDSLSHFIGSKKDRYLRVIARWQSENELLVVSAFYDRRLSRRRRHDKD